MGLLWLLLWLQVVFLWILARLDGGATYGMAGFMFWFIVPPMMSFILRLRDNIFGNIAIVVFPGILTGALGLQPVLDLAKLNALLVPAGFITVVGHVLIDRLLRRIYEYRWQLQWRSVAIDALAEGVVIIQEGVIRYANQAASALVGCAPEQIIGAALSEFVSLVDHASEGILISQEGILRFVNPRIAALTGRAEKDLVGTPLLDCIHADDRPVLVDRHRRRRRGEPLSSHEVFRLVRADGEVSGSNSAASRSSGKASRRCSPSSSTSPSASGRRTSCGAPRRTTATSSRTRRSASRSSTATA